MDALLTANSPRVLLVVNNDDTYGDRLKRIRGRLKLSTREVARRSENAFTHAYVSSLENDQSPWKKASLAILEGLARAYRMTVDVLIKEVEGKDSEVKETTRPERPIPVYDLVSAGQGLDGGQVIDEITIPLDWHGEFVAYHIEGSSMAPTIPSGVVVKVEVQDHADSGQIIVCFCPGKGMMLKEYGGMTPDGYHALTSHNPEFKPIYTKELHIKGVVISHEVMHRKPRRNGKRFN